MKHFFILLWVSVCTINALAADSTARISITVESAMQGRDSITVCFYPCGYGFSDYVKKKKVYYLRDKRVDIELEGPISNDYDVEFFFSSEMKMKPGVYRYHIGPGDVIGIDFRNDTVIFTGKRKLFYCLKEKLWRLSQQGYSISTMQTIRQDLARFDSLFFTGSLLLRDKQNRLTKEEYNYLIASFVCDVEEMKSSCLYFLYDSFGNTDTSKLLSLKYYIFKEVWAPHRQKSELEHSILPLLTCQKMTQTCSKYAQLEYNAYIWDSCYAFKRRPDYLAMAKYFENSFEGYGRECTFVNLLTKLMNGDAADNFDGILKIANKYVSNFGLKQFVEQVSNARMQGRPFYNFALQDTNGDIRYLDELKDTVLLVDFWFTGCGNCVRVHPLIDSIKNLFEKRPFKVITISIDKDDNVWKKSVATGKYTSVDNVNLNTGLIGIDHPLIKFYQIEAYPQFFLVDKKGQFISAPMDPRGDKGRNMIVAISRVID